MDVQSSVVSPPRFEVWLICAGKMPERAEDFPMSEGTARAYCRGFNTQERKSSQPTGFRAVVRPVFSAAEAGKESLMGSLTTIARSYSLPIETKTFYRVDIVCESKQSRAPGDKPMTKEEAEGVANWFGRTDDLRAVVVGPLEQVTITIEGGKDGAA
jgi:hypothetical protein